MKYLVLLWGVFVAVSADMYLHNPRGSNNRLDEAGRARNNANRMFDSQNNNRGGYNVGSLYYYQGTVLPIEWTNQHSCGDQNTHCDIILQYMCGDQVRDGILTQTIPDNPVLCKKYDCSLDSRFGMHENFDYYMKCKQRKRNQGLFTADQNLKGQTAKYTRQNPAGTRRGFECPEERDYYPYWHPTPWKDIVVMTNEPSRCELYQRESENVKGRTACVLPSDYTWVMKWRNYIIPSTKEECEKFRYPMNNPNGSRAEWKQFPSHNLPAPECRETDWSRDNHLGNGVGGFPNGFNWTLPKINHERCALRIRYNISTGEFDGWDSRVNSSLNSKPKQKTKLDIGERFDMNSTEAEARGYVYKQNPEVSLFGGIFSSKLKLRLAINTNQLGRVFQDRSHTFAIRSRPSKLEGQTIHNLNVRGKRGNIVQVYPAVEYDFVPNTLEAMDGHYVHFQWTGSNTNPNNNDGQGKAGTDRSNVVMLEKQRYPEGEPKSAEEKHGQLGLSYPEHLSRSDFLGFSKKDLTELAIMYSSQFRGEMSELDDAGTYFNLGPRKITGSGVYNYMSTRNNNFSNRSQKGKIVLTTASNFAKRIGSRGGEILFGDDKEGVWIEPQALKSLETIQIQRYSPDEGEKMIKDRGGKMGVGSDYASDFVVLNPQNLRTVGGKKISVKVKVDSSVTSPPQMFRANEQENFRTWYKVDAEISDGVASFQTEQGGAYVARTVPNHAAIAGIVVGVVVLVCIIVGTACYFKHKPEKWTRLRTACSGAKRSLQNKV